MWEDKETMSNQKMVRSQEGDGGPARLLSSSMHGASCWVQRGGK